VHWAGAVVQLLVKLVKTCVGTVGTFTDVAVRPAGSVSVIVIALPSVEAPPALMTVRRYLGWAPDSPKFVG
jgi:hypothetical protein